MIIHTWNEYHYNWYALTFMRLARDLQLSGHSRLTETWLTTVYEGKIIVGLKSLVSTAWFLTRPVWNKQMQLHSEHANCGIFSGMAFFFTLYIHVYILDLCIHTVSFTLMKIFMISENNWPSLYLLYYFKVGFSSAISVHQHLAHSVCSNLMDLKTSLEISHHWNWSAQSKMSVLTGWPIRAAFTNHSVSREITEANKQFNRNPF